MTNSVTTFPALSSIIVLGVLMTTGTATAQTAENRINLEYDFTGAGIRILEATFDLTFDQKNYLVRSRLNTKGLASIFSKSVTYLGARGTLGPKLAQPEEFQSRTEKGQKQKTASITWLKENQLKIDVLPQPNKSRQASINKFLKPGFPDPLSALVAITFSADKLCRNKIRSFDGRKIFDFKLEYLGKEELQKGDAGAYFGPAHKCSFTNTPIAGYSKKRMKAHRTKPTPAYTIWFAPIEAASKSRTIFVPVKATGTINWASVGVVLTKGSINGQPLRALR